MRALLTLALLFIAVSAHALSITVDPSGSIQQVLDDAANYDTLYLKTAGYDEDLVVRRAVVILPEPNFRTSTPSLRSLTVELPPGGGLGVAIQGVRVLHETRVVSISNTEVAITGCRLDGGLTTPNPNLPINGVLRVTYCTIFGDVVVAVYRTDFAMNTVLGGGVKLRGGSLGMSRVAASHVQDAPAIAIEVLDDPNDALIEGSTVTRAAQGLLLWRGGRATGNVVTDIEGDGMMAAIASQAGTIVSANRFERCGRGIVNVGGQGASSVTGNVVLNSVGDGIVAPGGLDVAGNTVALSAGVGITAGGTASRNLVAFNRGVGMAAAGTCNLLWSNGLDARSAGNLYADPLFCGLDVGDVHVSASSPALGGVCGQIGALGAGCGIRPNLAPESAAASTELGVQQRGRVALVTLAGDEPAALEILDVAGRRLSRMAIAGSRKVELDQPAGVYFMRLIQGARSSMAKAVLR